MTVLLRVCVVVATFLIAVLYVVAASRTTQQTQTARYHEVHSQSLKHRQNKRHHRRGKKASMKPTSDPVRPASSADAKKAGEFNGDVRDLPQTGPVKKERPQREAPRIQPRAYPTPTPE